MRRIPKSSYVLASLLISSQCLGQESLPEVPPDETPMAPVRAWTSGEVLGLTAPSDPRVTQIQRWDIYYTVGSPSTRSPEHIADQIAYMIHTAGLPSGRVAVELVNVATGNLTQIPAGTGYMRFPALLAHEYDTLFQGPSLDPIENARTPWMYWGILEGTEWMEAFIEELDDKVGLDYIPVPDRFIFDDEPGDFFVGTFHLDSTNISNVVDYWSYMVLDTRWDTEPVPGFNGDTMDDLWYDAVNNQGVTDPTVPGTWNSSYYGGSAANEKWVYWFRSVMRQAEEGAMQEAYYDTIHATFPDAKCSDYDRSMWTDGSDNNNNSWFGGDWAGATGRRMHWDGQGDLQAPCMYLQAGSDFYNQSAASRYALTNDVGNELDWCPFEPIDMYSSRIGRFVMDACVRSFSGSRKGSLVSGNFEGTLAPWLPLPGMFFLLGGADVWVSDCYPSTEIDGTFGAGNFYIAYCDYVRRTLANARARGSCEVHFWNDVGLHLDAGGLEGCLYNAYTDINASVGPQKDFPYDRVSALLDQVWGFRYYSKSAATGSVSAGGSSSPPALEFAFGDQLQMTPATVSGQFKTAIKATFTNSYSILHGDPAYLRINIEASSTSNTTLSVDVWDYTHSEWDAVDIDPSGNTATAGDITGGSPGPTKRVSGRIAGPDHFGGFGEVTVRAKTAGATAGGTNYVYYDLIQVVADDDVEFSSADINFDGVVDCSDYATWKYIYYAASHGSPPGRLLSLADFNHDGAVNTSDDSAFEAAWGLECEESCDLDVCVLP
ncbi:MAG: hypothetical protein U0573_02085 [Phycisphaerales bacterium]|nr:hypothetical protein [Planctomycetota bacterium]